MYYFTVTVVSPSGFRDHYYVNAQNDMVARENVRVQMIMTRPNWKIVKVSS